MRGRTCLVTGANAGIGKATVAGLAARGDRVIMVCRDRVRAERAMSEIRARVPGAALELALADLSSLRAVRCLIDEIEGRTNRLDVLVSNAGLFSFRRRLSQDGHELTLAVNHLAPFALVRGLLRLLRRSAPGRVVMVASGAHHSGTIAFGDLQGERRYGGWRAYAQSKLANVLFAAELARRVPAAEVTANAVHPGTVATKLLLRGIVPPRVAGAFIRTPEEGARTPLHVATAAELEGVTGRYFEDCEVTRPSGEARDPGVASHLWAVSEDLTNLREERNT